MINIGLNIHFLSLLLPESFFVRVSEFLYALMSTGPTEIIAFDFLSLSNMLLKSVFRSAGVKTFPEK